VGEGREKDLTGRAGDGSGPNRQGTTPSRMLANLFARERNGRTSTSGQREPLTSGQWRERFFQPLARRFLLLT